MRLLLIGFLTALLTIGCSTFKAQKPSGFAEYQMKGDTYKAISSKGVLFKIKSIKNEPYGSKEMWQESVSHYFKTYGYQKKNSKNITTDKNIKGLYTEYLYRYNGENYIYSITIFVNKDNIFIIETSGIDNFYNNKRKDIIDAIKKIEIL
jgi:hypothetical protein